MFIFDGYTFAKEKEIILQQRVTELHQRGIFPKIAAILFREDSGSQLYTRLKKEAAERVGIGYEVFEFSMRDEVEGVAAKIQEVCADATVTGLIVQKPARVVWEKVTNKKNFGEWWLSLVSAIDPAKDVDGLSQETLAAIQRGTWKQESKVIPATAKAVLEILKVAAEKTGLQLSQATIIILGKSDLLGKPLFFELSNQKMNVELLGRKELVERITSGQKLHDADVVISATGQPNIITGDMIKTGAVVIDVGEPKGDVEFTTVSQKAAFMTPVPGGVGPLTVLSLLENSVSLSQPGDKVF